jgi:DNA (cytosine-5)-methyltransferase 1
MRFELSNRGEDSTEWRIRFLFGPSRDIREIDLDLALLDELGTSTFLQGARATLRRHFLEVEALLGRTSPHGLQAAWTRRGDGPRPFELCDALGDLAGVLQRLLMEAPSDVKHAAVGYVLEAAAQGDPEEIVGARKLTMNALAILSGLLVGSWFNTLEWHAGQRLAA